jgi:hypothetical protein
MPNKGDLLVIALMLGTILLLNLFATRAVLRDDLSERGQRIAQILMVWLFPLLGALLVLAVHRAPQKPSGQYRDRGSEDHAFDATGRRPGLSDVIDD